MRRLSFDGRTFTWSGGRDLVPPCLYIQKMYRVWLTKHFSDFCGNNVQHYHWSRGAHSPKCKSCGTHDEYMMHLCWCRDRGLDQMFKILVTELQAWMATTLGELTVVSTIEAYLLSRGESTMVSCLHGNCNNL